MAIPNSFVATPQIKIVGDAWLETKSNADETEERIQNVIFASARRLRNCPLWLSSEHAQQDSRLQVT